MNNQMFSIIMFIIGGLFLYSIISRIDRKIKDLKINKNCKKSTRQELKRIVYKQFVKQRLLKIKKEKSKNKVDKVKTKTVTKSIIPKIVQEEKYYPTRQELEEEETIRTKLEDLTRKREKNRVRREIIEMKNRKKINSNPVKLV